MSIEAFTTWADVRNNLNVLLCHGYAVPLQEGLCALLLNDRKNSVEKEGYVIWEGLAVQVNFFSLKVWNIQNFNFLLFEMAIGFCYPKILLK